MFHAQDGLYFERQEDGSVKVRWEGGDLHRETVLPESSWASVASTTSRRGETRDTYLEALAWHSAEDVVLPAKDSNRVLVVHADEIPPEVLEQIGLRTSAALVVQLLPGQTLDVLDEDEMRQAGWFRLDLTSEDVGA